MKRNTKMDPNLQKFIDSNLEEIKQGNIGIIITHASSYLDYVYGYHNRDKRKIELTEFIDKLKMLANSFRLKNLNNGEKHAKGQPRGQTGRSQQNRRK